MCFFFLVTPCLDVSVQPCMEWIPIKKRKNQSFLQGIIYKDTSEIHFCRIYKNKIFTIDSVERTPNLVLHKIPFLKYLLLLLLMQASIIFYVFTGLYYRAWTIQWIHWKTFLCNYQFNIFFCKSRIGWFLFVSVLFHFFSDTTSQPGVL